MTLALRAAILSLLTAALVVTTTVVAPPEASAATYRERVLIAKINQARAAHGLRALTPRADLMSYARAHSRRMASRGYLYHTSNFRVICCWSSIGENVGYSGTIPNVHRAFMNSNGHRANVLSRGKRGVGVGVIHYRGRLWVTEVFRAPR